MKGSNLRCSLGQSQNKGLSRHRRRASGLCTGPYLPPEAEKQLCDSQSWKARGNLSPRDQHPPPNCEQIPPVASHVFLGSWKVDICQEGQGLRSAPQRRHMAHLRRRSRGAPGKPHSRSREVTKMHRPPGMVRLPSTWSPEMPGPGKGTKHIPN